MSYPDALLILNLTKTPALIHPIHFNETCSHVMDPSLSSDANGDTASPSPSDYTEADSDRRGDSATAGSRGVCFFMYITC